jgi:hypothetical protein
MGRRFAFSVAEAIPVAWKMIWDARLVAQKKETKGYRPSTNYYVTAADVENQVRELASATAKGKPWSEAPLAWGRGYDGIRISGNVQGAVRDWLFNEVRAGRLQSHNFGRGHVSGARFRPVGVPLHEAELKTFEMKEKRAAKVAAGLPSRPTHFSKSGYGGRPACSKPTACRWRSSKAWTSRKWERVTCPRCLKLKGTFPEPKKEEEEA